MLEVWTIISLIPNDSNKLHMGSNILKSTAKRSNACNKMDRRISNFGRHSINSKMKQKTIIGIIFFIVTSFFVIQQTYNYSWDFHSYILNAEYLLGEGNYFEPLRPPLMPIIIGILESVMNRTLAEYGFIILASTIFMFSCMRLAKALKFDKTIFYLISSNVYVLTLGLFNGTELLAYSFMQLFIAELILNKNSGIYLGLFVLSRYAGLMFVPLILLHKNWKKIILNCLSFFGVVFPWLLYNFNKYGNWFTSIADQYANNIYFREYISTAIDPTHFLKIIWNNAPLAILGVLGIITIIATTKIRKEKIKNFLIIMIVASITIYSYVQTPIKSARYLFNLALPFAYLAYYGYKFLQIKLSPQIARKVVYGVFIIGLLVTFPIITTPSGNSKIYQNAIKDLEEYENCSIMSNGWVELNYEGRTTMDFPRKELVENRIKEGEIIVLFPHISEPSYARNETFLSQFNVIKKTEQYIIVGNGCKPIEKNDQTYVKKLADTIEEMHGYRTEERPCQLLLKNEFLISVCEMMNFT